MPCGCSLNRRLSEPCAGIGSSPCANPAGYSKRFWTVRATRARSYTSLSVLITQDRAGCSVSGQFRSFSRQVVRARAWRVQVCRPWPAGACVRACRACGRCCARGSSLMHTHPDPWDPGDAWHTQAQGSYVATSKYSPSTWIHIDAYLALHRSRRLRLRMLLMIPTLPVGNRSRGGWTLS